MPISGSGWEIHFDRIGEQSKPTQPSKRRTVGNYQVYHNGIAQTGGDMRGMFAETRGPGDNSSAGIAKRRVEIGRYPLFTQNGTKYKTHGYVNSNMTNVTPRPGIELMETGSRTEILIHPASGFLWSIGCINLCTSLPNGAETIYYTGSRRRVISVIEDMKSFFGSSFPAHNGLAIANAWAVVDGDP